MGCFDLSEWLWGCVVCAVFLRFEFQNVQRTAQLSSSLSRSLARSIARRRSISNVGPAPMGNERE